MHPEPHLKLAEEGSAGDFHFVVQIVVILLGVTYQYQHLLSDCEFWVLSWIQPWSLLVPAAYLWITVKLLQYTPPTT